MSFEGNLFFFFFNSENSEFVNCGICIDVDVCVDKKLVLNMGLWYDNIDINEK